MPVFYSLISRRKVVVCDFAFPGIKLERVAQECLDNLGPSDIERCQSTGAFLVFTLVDEGLTYLCITDDEFSNPKAFVHLNAIKRELRAAGLHSRAKSNLCGMFELRMDFAETLERLTNEACGDHVSVLRTQTDTVRNKMKENINKVTERGESLVDLEGRSETLALNSSEFQRSANKLRKKLYWKSVRLWVLLIAVLLAVLIAIIVVIVVALLATKNL